MCQAASLLTSLCGLFLGLLADLLDVDADRPLAPPGGLRALPADLLAAAVADPPVGLDHLHPVDVLLAGQGEVVAGDVVGLARVVVVRAVREPVGDLPVVPLDEGDDLVDRVVLKATEGVVPGDVRLVGDDPCGSVTDAVHLSQCALDAHGAVEVGLTDPDEIPEVLVVLLSFVRAHVCMRVWCVVSVRGRCSCRVGGARSGVRAVTGALGRRGGDSNPGGITPQS